MRFFSLIKNTCSPACFDCDVVVGARKAGFQIFCEFPAQKSQEFTENGVKTNATSKWQL